MFGSPIVRPRIEENKTPVLYRCELKNPVYPAISVGDISLIYNVFTVVFNPTLSPQINLPIYIHFISVTNKEKHKRKVPRIPIISIHMIDFHLPNLLANTPPRTEPGIAINGTRAERMPMCCICSAVVQLK